MAFKLYVDSDGIPYSEYGGYGGVDIGQQRSYLSIAERGLWYLNTFMMISDDLPPLLSYNWKRWPVNKDINPKDAREALRMATNCADWLMANIIERDEFLIWVHDYGFNYNTKPGWCSSHTQAMGMQLLIRITEITNDQRYSTPITGLLKAYSKPIEKGGLCVPIGKDGLWFEKIADPDNDQPKVLNGMMFAVLGLYDIANRPSVNFATRDTALTLAQLGVKATVYLLPRFDLKDWSAYTIHGKRASIRYHRIHIQQLERLFDITKNPVFSYWGDRYRLYLDKYSSPGMN